MYLLTIDAVIALQMMGFDLAIILLGRYWSTQEEKRSLQATKLNLELEHLKAQINPHFFMNMLNNIHGMVEINPTQAQVMIMELSKMMRKRFSSKKQSSSFVDISLQVREGQVCFTCDNSVHHQPAITAKSGGIGFANLRQRLQLLYGANFTLCIEDDNKQLQERPADLSESSLLIGGFVRMKVLYI